MCEEEVDSMVWYDPVLLLCGTTVKCQVHAVCGDGFPFLVSDLPSWQPRWIQFTNYLELLDISTNQSTMVHHKS